VLYSVHQRTCVNRRIGGDVPVSRQIAAQPRQSYKPRHSGKGITGWHGLLGWRQLLAIIFVRERCEVLEGLKGTAITGIGRLYLRQPRGDIASIHYMLFEKFGQVILPGFLIESERKMLRIYLPDVE